MILLSSLPYPSNYYKQLVKHGLHLSKHAVRIITVTSVVAGASFVAINAALLTMQITSLPLFLKVSGINLSLRTPAEARVLLNSYGQAQTLNLTIQGKNYKSPAASAGIKLDTDAIMRSIKHPGGWDKIPLFYALNNRHRSFPLQYNLNSKSLKSYLDGITLPKEKLPTSASIVIPQNPTQVAYISQEEKGYLYSAEILADQVAQQVTKNKNLHIDVQPQTLQPKVSAGQLASQLDRANGLLKSSLSVTNGVQAYSLTAADMRKIIVITPSAEGLPEAAISHAQVVELLRAHSNLFYKAPTATKISTLDGNQVARTSGISGQAINIEASATQVAKALESGQTSQTITMSTVSPNTTYLRDYTATSAGLLALINDFAASHPGTYKVATIELNGNRSAYYGQDSAIVPASTYKLFVAYVALKKIEQGSLSFSSQTSAGSLDACLQKMILVSDNTCAQAILDLIGWSETENQVKAAGFSATNINNSGGGYMSTTAGDVAKLLKGFYDGSLLNNASISYLFDLMERQIYRSGIPAGSPGATVADKVGFLYSWNHDAAIVYGPNSTYILVIMTTNSSFSQIKQLASQIYNLYSQ